jgi:hypothetical protein
MVPPRLRPCQACGPARRKGAACPTSTTNEYEPDPEELARVRRENSPEGLADFFGDQAMITYHEVRKQPPGPDRSAAIELGMLESSIATYWVLRAKFGPPA